MSRPDRLTVSQDGRVQPVVCSDKCNWPNCTCDARYWEDAFLRDVPQKSNAPAGRSKYHREIKPGVWVDVYDVLQAWKVSNPALGHLIKKALQPGERGHKDLMTDLDDIVASAIRARELEDGQ